MNNVSFFSKNVSLISEIILEDKYWKHEKDPETISLKQPHNLLELNLFSKQDFSTIDQLKYLYV